MHLSFSAARRNAEEAGVGHLIHFQQREVKDLQSSEKVWIYYYESAVRRTYLRKKKLFRNYIKNLETAFKNLDSWSAYMITSYEDAERYFGRKADKNRKIYNGMMRTYFYQFLGPKTAQKAERDRG